MSVTRRYTRYKRYNSYKSYNSYKLEAHMPELKLIDKLREFLKTAEGKEITLNDIRNELRIDPGVSGMERIKGTNVQTIRGKKEGGETYW